MAPADLFIAFTLNYSRDTVTFWMAREIIHPPEIANKQSRKQKFWEFRNKAGWNLGMNLEYPKISEI